MEHDAKIVHGARLRATLVNSVWLILSLANLLCQCRGEFRRLDFLQPKSLAGYILYAPPPAAQSGADFIGHAVFKI